MVYCYGIYFTEGLSNSFFGILSFSSKIFIEGTLCVVALAPAVMTNSGSTFNPLLVMLSISD